VKRISWTIIAALVATLFLPVNAAQAGTTTEACVSGSAILSYPKPLAIDQSGNLFFVDSYNYVIRKVLRGSRSVVNVTFNDSSVAGQSLKDQLQSGNGENMRLGLDAVGNLFIAVNYAPEFVYKLTPSGIVSVVAGTGTGGYTGDGGLATAATIHNPSGLAIDASGNIYISDYAENVIRKINASDGKINTVVGGSATFPGLSQPGPLASDSSGQLFIATGDGLILKRTVQGIVSVFAGSESNPISAQSVAVDSNGTVTYLVNGGREIYQINSSTKAITKIAGGTVSVHPGNSLDHRFGGDWAAGHSIVVDSSGKVYVSDSHQALIKKIDPTTFTISEYAGVAHWVGNSYIYTPTDGTKAIYANYRGTEGLAASSNGDIYFSGSDGHNTVVKESKSTGLITNIAGDLTGIGGFTADGATAAGAKVDNPGSVAIDALGNVYFLDLGNNRLRKIKVSDGKIITIAGTGTSGYSASDVSAASSPITAVGSDKIAVDSLGNVYLTDNTNHVIRKITAGANPTISNIASGIAVITGLSVDSVNNFLYFSTESAIKKINISSSSPTVTSVATLGTHFVRALAIDPATQTLYYANESPQNARTIGKILNASTSQTTILAGPTSLVAGGGSLNYVSAGAPATSVRLGDRITLAFSSGTSTLYVGHVFVTTENSNSGAFQAINVSAGTISTVSGFALDGPAPLCVEYEVVPTITAGNNGAQAAAIPATASSAVFSSPSILNTTLKFTSTSATASATVTPVSSNPASSAATPFKVTGSTKIVDIQVTGIAGPVTICLDGASTDSIFHYKDAKWVELPSRTYTNGQVCGVTDSFSPFTAAEKQANAAPVVVYVPPTPVPYLKTLSNPQIHLVGDKFVCTAGTYNSGYTLDGVIQGSATALYTPASYTFNLLFNQVAQNPLAVTAAKNSASWSVSSAPAGALVSCSVTVAANSLKNTDSSTANPAAVSAALTTQSQSASAAESAYNAAVSANSKSYQKALVDNRATWRANVDKVRTAYFAELTRINGLPYSKANSDLKSAALKAYLAAQKKTAVDYKASGPAALVVRDLANKAALDTKTAAIVKANSVYGTFIESIGYGVLVP
jgi:sugar lactone lactonase YvrE